MKLTGIRLWLRRGTYLLSGWCGFFALFFAVTGQWREAVLILVGLVLYLWIYGMWCKHDGC